MSNTLADCQPDRVLVEMRVMLEDLVLFHGLKPDNDTVYSAEDLRAAAKKHEAFLLKHFAIRDAQLHLEMNKAKEEAVAAMKKAQEEAASNSQNYFASQHKNNDVGSSFSRSMFSLIHF